MNTDVTVDPCAVGSLAKKASSLSIPIASLKFPAISALSYSTIRTKDWDDILTAHTDEAVARSWTMKDKRVGKHVFTVAGEKKKGAAIGSVKVRISPRWTIVPLLMLPSGGVRHGVWQLRYRSVVDRRHQHVQHPVRNPAPHIRRRALSVECPQSLPANCEWEKEGRALYHGPRE